MAVVTSRADLSGLTISDGARPVPLSTLNDREALALLSLGIGDERTSAEPEIADEVIRRCAGLPLALAIAAARVATQPQVSLAQATVSLRHGPTTIEALGGPDPATDVRTVFSWSYTSLSSRAARMFRLAGAYAGPHVSLTAAASAAAEPIDVAELLLKQLQAAHLIVAVAADRFSMHDLLREYAVQQSGADDKAAVRTASRDRLFDHYRHSAYRASRRLYPEFHIPVPADPLPGVLVDDIGSDEEARRWFDDNHAIVVAMICNAADQGPDDAGIHLCRIINGYLDRAGHWPERITSGLAALRSANRAADFQSMANLHIGLGFAYVSRSDPAEAEHHLHRAGELYHRLGDADGEARAHVGLTHVFDPQGRYAEAAAHADKAHRRRFSRGREPHEPGEQRTRSGPPRSRPSPRRPRGRRHRSPAASGRGSDSPHAAHLRSRSSPVNQQIAAMSSRGSRHCRPRVGGVGRDGSDTAHPALLRSPRATLGPASELHDPR